jgi:glycosyltransferase involved in cell wall biosynthesis
MNRSKGRIVYVGPMSFPNGGAAARRILGNSLSLIEAGYEVIIGSGQMPKVESQKAEVFQGISIHSLGERIAENKPVLLKHLAYSVMGKKTIEWLNILNPKPTAIILYSGDLPYLIRLIPWCRKRGIPLIYEAAEWFDPENVPGGRFSPYRLNHEFTMRYLVQRVKNVISISSFLENHYQLLGCNTICIPPTIDSQHFQFVIKPKTEKIIKIGYTGSPGKKDLFNNYLEAFLQIDPKGERFKFNVAGLTTKEILCYPAMKIRNLNELPKLINNIGKVSHSEAINLISNSDFSILLRYPKRGSNAGFPTKVVESMVMGTPVICNLTSDLHKYIKDGISGIVCKDHQVESLIGALKKANNLSSQEINNMSCIARKIGEESFDYRSYILPLDNFIQNLNIL